jgi:hypothetical protein
MPEMPAKPDWNAIARWLYEECGGDNGGPDFRGDYFEQARKKYPDYNGGSDDTDYAQLEITADMMDWAAEAGHLHDFSPEEIDEIELHLGLEVYEGLT